MKTLQSVVHFVESLPRKPWLVVGKGPTTDRIGSVDTSQYHVLTLNHACLIVRPQIAHFVDLDALEDCEPRLRNQTYIDGQVRLCLPWRPHEKFKAGQKTLAQVVGADYRGVIADYARAERLLAYNSTTSKLEPNQALPVIRLRYFSAVAAFNILGAAGVRDVYSLGVDGGTGYGKAFDPATKLANGRQSFDAQTAEIVKAAAKYKMTWHKLEFLP